jgi:hypothetical protein
LWICFGVGVTMEKYAWLSWVYPGGYDRLLLSPDPADFAKGLGAALAFTALFIGGAIFVTTKRDV